jgi:TatD DNase family protein
MSPLRRFIDIGANLTDAMYSGIYNGTRKHEGDLQQVLQRSWNAGLKKIIITGGNLKESQMALSLATNDERLLPLWDVIQQGAWNLMKTLPHI